MSESKFKKSTWYDFVNQNIAETVKHNIQFNSPVNRIDYSDNNVIVTTKNGKTYEADRVIVTVSIGVLKSNVIRFIPEMNKEKRKAIESITFHPGFKVAMKFSEKFYPDDITYIVNNRGKGFYDIAFKRNAQTNVLGFLCTRNETKKYYNLESEQEIISSLLDELDKMFDGKASTLYSGKYILENWRQYEFTQGTWTQAFQKKILSQSS